jgi:hypothetical protein
MLKRLEALAGDSTDGRALSELVRDALREYLWREEGRCERCGQEKADAAQGEHPHVKFPYSQKSSSAKKPPEGKGRREDAGNPSTHPKGK